MSHELHLWVHDRKVAIITHDAKDDHWSMAYDEAWAADPQSFPISPALPVVPLEAGYSSNALKRFLEHLLPEGRALDVAVAYNGLSKSNVFGLIRALGAETAGALRFTADATDTAPDDPAPKLAIQAAAQQAQSELYLADERPFIQGIAHFVMQQAQRLSKLVSDAAAIKADYL